MNAFAETIRRECRVAFSLKAQPLWFCILKWIAIIAFVSAFHDRGWFWPLAAAVAVLALSLHFTYRWKTRAWTRPWGGWNDLEAGRR